MPCSDFRAHAERDAAVAKAAPHTLAMLEKAYAAAKEAGNSTQPVLNVINNLPQDELDALVALPGKLTELRLIIRRTASAIPMMAEIDYENFGSAA